MSNRLTYVASGCSYTRFNLKANESSPKTIEWIRSAFKKMQKDPNHSFGTLYNAWTEQEFGPIFKQNYRDVLECIQADSGGLQIVTQGKTITSDMVDSVFDNQARYSTMAMSFDEIPLSFSGAKSTRLDLSNRWFDEHKFEECAKQTGRNVFKQIQKFVDMKSESKPIFITQGNCYETYMQWTDLAMKEIPQEYHQHIGGVAMGAAALGHGMLEDIQRAFFYTQLPMNLSSNHLHLLAVGSVFRLVPNMIFMKSGLYKDLHLTYDSTSHTCAATMGRFYAEKKAIDFPRRFEKVLYTKIYDDIRSKFELDMTLEEFHEAVNSTSRKFDEKYGNIHNFVVAQMAITLSTIQNFKDHVDACMKSDKELLSQVDSRDNPAFIKSLYKIKTKDDFDAWMRDVGKYMVSHSVQTGKPVTLDDF
jgi:hypothetical protein